MTIDEQHVTKTGSLYHITFVMNGVQKRWTGDQRDFDELATLIFRTQGLIGNVYDGVPETSRAGRPKKATPFEIEA